MDILQRKISKVKSLNQQLDQITCPAKELNSEVIKEKPKQRWVKNNWELRF
ncbi:MAG: hypothetical protein HZB99_03720 [Candidatus Harrisonbacteria bacterium]|nr:hypothetical protein [Candidatus Harrisonbacteria bacterium]